MSNAVNVKVAVRCRPLSRREIERASREIIEIEEGKSVWIADPTDGKKKQFTFDHSYFSDSTQQQVYEDIGKPIVEQALQGYNGTIFAYGQTGSGKTHTMMGSGSDVGVIPLMNDDIFSRVEKMTNDTTKFLITVSFLEIYNEVIKDLLNPSDKFLKIREHPDMGIYVENLAELIVREPSDVTSLIEQGNKVRQVAATQMNERSSRSHSCFTIKIGMKVTETIGEVEREVSTNSKINLVDLAGSERAAKTGATGDRLKEGAAINKSLSALGNVINMLADRSKKGHVPYRDSKLTRLLQESLGGNALTVMVAAISPADYNHDETIGTLQYADRAKSIKNATKKNEDVNDTIIRELREEIERLREMVQGGASGASPGAGAASVTTTSAEDMSKMEEMIANLERAKQQSWQEKERLAKLYEIERQKSLANETNVLQFMQTVKEEKVEAMKRVRFLQQQKAKLSKKFREKKETYSFNKAQLQSDMAQYQELLQRVDTMDDAASKERESELQSLLDKIETTRASLVTDRDLLTKIKDKQAEIDEKLVLEKAEMAAKSAVLQEDENLRKAIQDDERSKMEKLKEEYLETALEDERQRLQAEIEFEKTRLERKYQDSAEWMEKEESLKKEVFIHQKNASKLRQKLVLVKDIQVGHHTLTKQAFQQIVHDLTATFAQERREIELKYHTALELLQQARHDIAYLSVQNRELERQVALATAWEQPI